MIAALAVITIYYCQVIIMPIVFSALCVMLVHPLVKRLESWGMNLLLASLIVVVFVTSIIAGVLFLSFIEGVEIVKNIPVENVEGITENPIDTISQESAERISLSESEISVYISQIKDELVAKIPTVLGNLNSFLIFLISCPIYIFFMLISRSSIRGFYYSCFQQNKRHIANRILCQIEMVYISYLKGMLYVITIVAVLTSVGLYALGIEHAIFIGVLSGFLTLVPYVGVIVGALIPVAIAFFTKDSLWYPIGVVMVYAAVQFLEGNIITPKIMGNQVGVNPLMVIIGIVVFGAIGGILGMVLTVPVLALLKVVSKYVPGWKPLNNLLKV